MKYIFLLLFIALTSCTTSRTSQTTAQRSITEVSNTPITDRASITAYCQGGPFSAIGSGELPKEVVLQYKQKISFHGPLLYESENFEGFTIKANLGSGWSTATNLIEFQKDRTLFIDFYSIRRGEVSTWGDLETRLKIGSSWVHCSLFNDQK